MKSSKNSELFMTVGMAFTFGCLVYINYDVFAILDSVQKNPNVSPGLSMRACQRISNESVAAGCSVGAYVEPINEIQMLTLSTSGLTNEQECVELCQEYASDCIHGCLLYLECRVSMCEKIDLDSLLRPTVLFAVMGVVLIVCTFILLLFGMCTAERSDAIVSILSLLNQGLPNIGKKLVCCCDEIVIQDESPEFFQEFV